MLPVERFYESSHTLGCQEFWGTKLESKSLDLRNVQAQLPKLRLGHLDSRSNEQQKQGQLNRLRRLRNQTVFRGSFRGRTELDTVALPFSKAVCDFSIGLLTNRWKQNEWNCSNKSAIEAFKSVFVCKYK